MLLKDKASTDFYEMIYRQTEELPGRIADLPGSEGTIRY